MEGPEQDEELVTDDEHVWVPGDPCGKCGSTDTGWDVIDGGICFSCGGQDFEG